MKFMLWVTVKGPTGEKAESEGVEKEYINLASLLLDVAKHLPSNRQLGIVPVGIRIEELEAENEDDSAVDDASETPDLRRN